MRVGTPAVNFRSDNEYPVAPEIMAALEAANHGSAHSYGADGISDRVRDRFRDLFECDLTVLPLVSGTAANALACAHVATSVDAVICHRDAHLQTDECGAPEFFTGGAKLHAVGGAHGKLEPEQVRQRIETELALGEHASRPRLISVTQATELGTVYRPAEVHEIAALAHRQGLKVHMDGARLANAIATLDCTPAEATWRAGVDLLSFGATKNGAMMAEALLVFDTIDSGTLARRRKQSGHLLSKLRFVSAQLEAYLTDDLWLRLARRANDLASELAVGLSELAGVELIHPVESNEVFVRMLPSLADGLREAGFEFHHWPHGGEDVFRLVTSFATPEHATGDLVASLRELTEKAPIRPER